MNNSFIIEGAGYQQPYVPNAYAQQMQFGSEIIFNGNQQYGNMQPQDQFGVQQNQYASLQQVASLLPSAADYRQPTPREHVLLQPGMYVGSIEQVPRDSWIWNGETKSMVYGSITFPEAMERIFLEVISNAADAVNDARLLNVDPGTLKVTLDQQMITVENEGIPLQVLMHASGVYLPTFVLGRLLASNRSSNNTNRAKHAVGQNGIGGKACNIFSKWFRVVIHDSINHLYFEQTWKENMSIEEDPIIRPYDGNASSTKIMYVVDFERFKYDPAQGYPPETLPLISKHVIDISFTSRIPVHFNGQPIPYVDNIRDFASYYFPGEIVNTAIYYEWEPGVEVMTGKGGIQKSRNGVKVPLTEIIFLDTPDRAHYVSFVSSLMTRDGGPHVTNALDIVSKHLTGYVNDISNNKVKNKGKGKAADAKKKGAGTVNINISHVKPHLSVLVSIRIENPAFNSQSKNMLTTTVPPYKFPEKMFKTLEDWDLVKRLFLTVKVLQRAKLSKTDGKKKKRVTGIDELEDANDAGSKYSEQCTLCICEGLSAKGTVLEIITRIPGGRDRYGVLPIRGKGLNVMNASLRRLLENEEIAALKKVLGLEEGMDYTDPNNRKRLRYGRVMMFADADMDGKHIAALSMLSLYCMHPTLYAAPFFYMWSSPILRIAKGSQEFSFYSELDFAKWQKSTPDHMTWKITYYKGLGSSSKEEIMADLATIRTLYCFYDDNTPYAMSLAFDNKLADERKKWLAEWTPEIGISYMEKMPIQQWFNDNINYLEVWQPISYFILYDFVQFCIANMRRSLPSVADGLKVSQRKLLAYVFKKFRVGPLKKKYEPVNVATIASSAISEMRHHHGNKCLSDALYGMGRGEYPGSNNIIYFVPKGQFGTRHKGGGDAADPRYTRTEPGPLMPYIFRQEDNKILEILTDDGIEVEPKEFYPIVPMGLINGTCGIGTAWSSFTPNYNPLDIFQAVRQLLHGTVPYELIPWYRDFTGTISIVHKSKLKKEQQFIWNTLDKEEKKFLERLNLNEEEQDAMVAQTREILEAQIRQKAQDGVGTGRYKTMRTMGNWQISCVGEIMVTELPIGLWNTSYKVILDEWIDNKQITGYRNYSTSEKANFKIQGFNKVQPDCKSLKLSKSYGMSNMVFLDDKYKPRRFLDATDYLQAYFKVRLAAYIRRKAATLAGLEQKVKDLNDKVRYVLSVRDKQNPLILTNRSREEILNEMTLRNHAHDLLDKVRGRYFNDNGLAELYAKIQNKMNEYQAYENKPVEQIWLEELNELEEAYYKVYKIKRETPAIAQLSFA